MDRLQEEREGGEAGGGGRDGEITEDVWAEDRAEISHRGVWMDGWRISPFYV